MKYISPKEFPLKYKIIWFVVSIFLIVLGYYLFVYDSYRYQTYNDDIGGVSLLIGILLIYMYFFGYGDKIRNWKQKFLYFSPVVVLFGFFVIIVMNKRDSYYEKEATTPSEAKIVGFEKVQEGRSRTKFSTIEYFAFGKTITQRTRSTENHEIGKIIKIKYSKDKPELFVVVE